MLWESLPEPIDLEIHDGDLYWTDRGAPPLGNTLTAHHYRPSGSPDGHQKSLADGFREAVGLAVDSEAVYVSDLSGRVRRIGRDARIGCWLTSTDRSPGSADWKAGHSVGCRPRSASAMKKPPPV